ncbi:MAG: TIGR03032 family protein [Pirellulaceae bacterium]
MNQTPESTRGEPLRSVHTSNLPTLLEELGISLLVSTYQAGKLIMLRSEGELLNTHFRLFDKPMGMAVDPHRLAIGSAMQVWEFHNIPAVCRRLNHPPDVSEEVPGDEPTEPRSPPTRPHDACFLPRIAHWTGDIQIHEMAWTDEGLVFVNTLFSCLCMRSDTFNFQPCWRPAFVTKYVPGDCCHLNGLGVRDGRVRYVTALGETDEPGLWRENKRDGGLLIDVDSGEVISRGLSMPHSPRWYNDRLYILQSGVGGFGTIDPATGKYESIVELPGFTRGLSFHGPFAFIGLSQVRETAVFGGIPIAERALEERVCGIWVVDLRSGQSIGFVRFEDAVQEIFAVEVLRGARYPELVNEDRKLLAGSYELPDATLAEVPDNLRSSPS